MPKKRELEEAGFMIENADAAEVETEKLTKDLQDYIQASPEPAPPKPKIDAGAGLIRILKVALYVFSLQLLTYAGAVGSFFLFLQAIKDPTWSKFGIAACFAVLVFLPTLYYSKNFR